MTEEMLSSTAAMILSLLFSYIPGFKNWYEPLAGNSKRLIMLALIGLCAIGSYALACLNLAEQFNIIAACDQNAAIELLRLFVAALVANQAAYAITPKAGN